MLTQPPRHSVTAAYQLKQKHVVLLVLALYLAPTLSARTLVVTHVFYPILSLLRWKKWEYLLRWKKVKPKMI
ncbi:hypothetical protein GUJ93_ZPchr0011g28114 [Zizania palustris]|uniref:Uncharacterized protein n=1 Tax=Zizania palustris TaxID=103762 RepID=A0A8J6BLL3_ZIZPA|nr:hypothetical protein GUJ93_ZPchr0011g28114 [Zizania palustris]